jgi:hypothetical protein
VQVTSLSLTRALSNQLQYQAWNVTESASEIGFITNQSRGTPSSEVSATATSDEIRSVTNELRATALMESSCSEIRAVMNEARADAEESSEICAVTSTTATHGSIE